MITETSRAPRRVLLSAVVAGLATVATAVAATRGEPAHASSPAQSRVDLLIRHVNVIDVATGRRLDDRRLAIAGGRVVSIYPEAYVEAPPAAALEVDARGAFVIPALWDMHVHLLEYPGLDSASAADATMPLLVANGVLGVRDLGSRDVAALTALRDEIAAGDRLGPEIVIADLAPPAGHRLLGVDVVAAARAGIRSIEQMADGRIRQQVYGYLVEGATPPADTHPGETARLMAAAKDAFHGRVRPNVWTQGTAAWLRSPRGRAEIGAMMRELGELRSLVVLRRTVRDDDTHDVAALGRHASGERVYRFLMHPARGIDWVPAEPDIALTSRIAALAESLRVTRVWITPTLAALHARAHRVERAGSADPRGVFLAAPARRDVDPADDPRMASWSGADWAMARRGYQIDAELVGRLRALGVRVLAGTDAITDCCIPGFALHDELWRLVEDAGLSPADALRAATLEPAEFLGRASDAGTVAVGKRANLVLLAGDPTTDIRQTAAIGAVVRDGVYLDRAALDRLLESVRDLVARRQPQP